MDINRGAIVVKAKQPYVDWANSCDDLPTKTSLDDVRDDCHTYLVPCWHDDDEFERILKRVSRIIFENELAGWTIDESAWPKRRGYETFRKWFDIERHTRNWTERTRQPTHRLGARRDAADTPRSGKSAA